MSAELINEIQKSIFKWYDFKRNASILFVDEVKELPQKKFDYIVSIATLEKIINPIDTLKKWQSLLKSSGCLLLGMNNRLGIKYFCGDRDPYTKRNFDGIENYYRAYANKSDTFNGRMYSRVEIEKILRSSGFENFKFYSVLTDLQNPSLIYAEDFLPNEDIANRIFPTYNYPNTIFLEEEVIYATLIENKLFHVMANAFLIECSPTKNFSDVLQVTNSIERGEENAMFTIIHRNNTVEKRSIYPAGLQRLKSLEKNLSALKSQGLKVIEGTFKNDRYIMPFVNAEVGQVYLKNLLLNDKEKFLQAIDQFRDCILKSSESFEENGEIILKNGYIDLVPLNSFHIDGEFVFYDQEFCIENLPLKVIIYRMITTLYFGNDELNRILTADELYSRYDLLNEKAKWQRLSRKFLIDLRNEKNLAVYHAKTRRNNLVVSANRQRLNYSAEDYQRIFVDIFENADTRKLILFGSGQRTKRFLELYGGDYEIYAIVDNNVDRQGQEIDGIKIQSPEIIKNLKSGEYKIIVCIKSYLSVVKQLETIGVTDYGIFDPNNNYPRKKKMIVQTTINNEAAKKKYHVGYIAGVFDLYHIGHLNMFRRAKEQCDYLIVGVVTDEGVRFKKGVEPFVPFDERVEMVKSCKYVDEVVKIPPTFSSTKDAWKLYHFDVQFSGSDYVNDGDWLANKEFLNEHGADLVFFPYTQSTSSTKLKKLIDQKLI